MAFEVSLIEDTGGSAHPNPIERWRRNFRSFSELASCLKGNPSGTSRALQERGFQRD